MQPADINEPIRQEMKRFRQLLPSLLAGEYAGKWVVFKDGAVKTAHGTSAEAYQAGVRNFGVMGGQIIVRVALEEPRPISAGAMFGRRP